MDCIRGCEHGSIETLEFDVVRRLAAACADSEPGKLRALAIVPSADAAEVAALIEQVVEMRGLLEDGACPSLSALLPMEELAERLHPEGATLSAQELLALGRHLATARDVRRALLSGPRLAGDKPPPYRRLASIASAIDDLPDLARRIGAAIDEDGSLRDEASPALARLRRKLAELDRRIRRTLDAMLSRRDIQDALSEPLITVREDRLVLPVRAERRQAVPGVLRGRSSSGQTVFVEPEPVVALGDEKLKVIEDERREVLRILRELSQAIRPDLPALVDSGRRLVMLDLIKARARLSSAYRGIAPSLRDEGVVFSIREGRHPLIDPALRPMLAAIGIEAKDGASDIVPVTVALPKGATSLVITGPNTGGKTATCKLVGLLHLMAQAGFLVPAAEGTVLSVWRTIVADIGDEQSLTQSLSTFSSHMSRIARFFDGLELPALVILDELGAGTDPREGESLGLAVLEELSAKGAHVIASTHYAAIKSYALAKAPSVLSVAMEWDDETLRPTYRISHGSSGSSHAIPIARRLRMDEAVIRRAEAHLEREKTEESRRVEELERELLAVEREREGLLRERSELREMVRVADELHAELKGKEARLASESRELLSQARRKVRAVLGHVEEQAEKLLAEAGRLAPAEVRKRRKAVLDHAFGEITGALPEEVTRSIPEAEPPPKEPLAPAPGRRARVKSLGVVGTILELGSRSSRGEASVHVDVSGKRLWVRPQDIDVLAAKAPSGEVTLLRTAETAEAVPLELSLLGMRVDEALDAADRYLDRAAASGLPSVRLVHGFGTGRLRTAVRDFLKRHPLVKEFRAGGDGEGGGGATVVTLR